ncbi:33804_t:CDS:2 [Racocetra persica]|uniref:33804_t:CDS:1 n=1 Tax=Racocetra persica TaxID=160502 RepID=A0ACA9L7T3_9GLOM|nr:33804_t:CDS:2 [Racocetra persica]
MTLKIIGFEVSSNTLSVIACLNELGLPYQIENPASWHALKEEDFLANKHPFGRIPVLYDGDYKITETRAICRYLVSKYQGKHNDTILIPHDINEAGLIDQLISYEVSYYEPLLKTIVLQEVFKLHPENHEIIKHTCEEIDKVLKVYDKLLEGKEYLNGEFSLADLLHCPYTQYIYSSTKHNDLWDKRPNVKKWWDRISNRDAWKKAWKISRDAWAAGDK